MNGLYYLAEANLYLGIFYLAYCLFLNRNTHYQLSRIYLVFSCMVAFLLPVVQVNALKPAKPATSVNLLTPIVSANALSQVEYAKPVSAVAPAKPLVVKTVQPSPAPALRAVPPVTERHFTWQDDLWYACLTGAAVLLCLLLIKLFTLFKLMRNEQPVNEGKYLLIYFDETKKTKTKNNKQNKDANTHGAK